MPLVSTECIQGLHQVPLSTDPNAVPAKQCPQFATYERMIEFEPSRVAPANPIECECPCHAAFAQRVRQEGLRRADQIMARAGLLANYPAGLWSDDEELSRTS